MTREPAEWRNHMTDAERADLARAERDHEDAAERKRSLVSKLKARCIKRMKRAEERG